MAKPKAVFFDWDATLTIADSESTVMFYGAKDVLEELQTRGYILGLISDTRRDALDRELSDNKVSELFDVVISGDDVERKRPNPEPLLLALDKLKLWANQTIFVGTTEHDIDATNAVEMRLILRKSAPDLDNPGIDYAVATEVFTEWSKFPFVLFPSLLKNRNKVRTRLDVVLSKKHQSLSRAYIQKLIKGGSVTVNDKVITKPSYDMSDDDKVRVTEPDTIDYPELNLPVLYEDKNVVVINKPVGVLSHSKGGFNPEATVATWLESREHYQFERDGLRHGIVHRLDRATSGVMICAKNAATMTMLQKQFQDRKTKKTYIARVAGVPDPAHAQIDLPIERNPRKPQTFRVGINGKTSFTEYSVTKEFDDNSALVELKPATGRTHQLRVHMEYIKHPIIGDTLYEGRTASRMYLHAAQLEITIPVGDRRVFDAPLPQEFTVDVAA